MGRFRRNLLVCKTIWKAFMQYSWQNPLWTTLPSIPISAVSIRLNTEGDNLPFYTDSIICFCSVFNNSYSSDLEITLLSDWFRTDILQKTEQYQRTNEKIRQYRECQIRPAHYWSGLRYVDGKRQRQFYLLEGCIAGGLWPVLMVDSYIVLWYNKLKWRRLICHLRMQNAGYCVFCQIHLRDTGGRYV